MASPQQSELPESDPQQPSTPDESATPDDSVVEEYEPRIIRLRLAPWDVVTTIVLLLALLYLVTMTGWTERLWAFTDNLCTGEECAPVPFGINYYIYPLMWGGIGAAFTAAILGPFVSLLKGWFMYFWPIVSVGVLTLASAFGSAATAFSQRYWI